MPLRLAALALVIAVLLYPPATMMAPAQAAGLPAEGPITPPPEPADTAPLVAEGKRLLAGEGVTADRPRALALFRQAAAKGSADGTYLEARTRLEDAEPGADPEALAVLFSLARRGHGDAAMFAGILCMQGRTGNPADGHLAPFMFNIARRTGQADAVKLHPRLVAVLREQGHVPPGSGTGDGIADPIIFSEVTDHVAGVQTEYEAAAVLYNGGKVVNQALIMQDEKSFDVLTVESMGGDSAVLYFDLTNWFGKGPLMESMSDKDDQPKDKPANGK